MDAPKPCPFCNAEIKHVESLARSFDPPRIYREYQHPGNDCVLLDISVTRLLGVFTENPAPRLKWIEAWNRRIPSDASQADSNTRSGE